jgi:hypothetical protein
VSVAVKLVTIVVCRGSLGVLTHLVCHERCVTECELWTSPGIDS